MTGTRSPSSIAARRAIVYVRQSTPGQVQNNHESRALQYALRERAVELGWPAETVAVVDEDLARSGSSTDGRLGFKELVAEVGLGRVGLILGTEVSRLARNNADWYQLLDLCTLTGTLVADSDGIYCPGNFNDRMLLGPEGNAGRGGAASDPRAAGRWACATRPRAASLS